MSANNKNIIDVAQLEQEYKKRREDYDKAKEQLEQEFSKVKALFEDLDVVVCNYKASVKEFPSVRRKFLKSRNENLFMEKDLVRGRIVLLNLQDLALAARFLKETLWRKGSRWSIEYIDNEDYYEKPKPGSMYRGLHFEVRLGDFPELPCEIQLRTLLDDAWAEWQHMVQYKAASAALSLVEDEFISGIAEHFDLLRVRTYNLRETVNERAALAHAVRFMHHFNSVDNLPEAAEMREKINNVTRETYLEFLSRTGLQQSSVHTTLSDEHFGISCGPVPMDSPLKFDNQPKFGCCPLEILMDFSAKEGLDNSKVPP